MSTILGQSVYEALTAADINFRELACDESLADTAAFCDHYGYTLQQAANTIIVAGKADPKRYAACVVLGDSRLDVNKKVCQLLDARRASFASGEEATKLTGMKIGGVVVFGLPSDIPIYVDSRVMEQTEVVMGGGNRTSKVLLAPAELTKLPNVEVVEGLAKPIEQA